MTEVKLKVVEAIQDDISKGLVRLDKSYMDELKINPGDFVSIMGERTSVAKVERSLPGDIGLSIVRMDGLTRRNAGARIGELVIIAKIDAIPAQNVTIAPAREGIKIKIDNPELLNRFLIGRVMQKGDLISLGTHQFQFAFGDLKFIVAETNPKKQAVVITSTTQIECLSESVELKDEPVVPEVSYEDIGGLAEELVKIREMIELPLRHPELFDRLGIEPPKGVLLHGPPGTGKTLLAKAVANETNSNFTVINGPEIMSKFYGQSEENLRKIFEEAEKNAPSIIFIDEIDAIAPKREESKGEVERRVVAQLLTIMDGLATRGRVVVMAATNIPNSIDPALRRPGRFDRELELAAPDIKGREKILKIHTRNMPLDGTLYPDILKKKVMSLLEENLSSFEKEKVEKEDEKKQLEEELKTLESKKRNSEDHLIQNIIDKLSGREKKLKTVQERLVILTDNTSIIEKAISNLTSKKILINDLCDSLIELNTKMIDLPYDDSRKTILENLSNPKMSVLLTELSTFDFDKDVIFLSKKEGIPRDMERVAQLTHGFVGADLASLAKEAAMNVLRKLLPQLKVSDDDTAVIPQNLLEKMVITQKDLIDALKVVRPSALREVLIETPNVKWDDIGGLEDVKQELIEAVDWPLKHKQVFTRLGVRPPKGVLIYGPPGTGKTLLAKAVAKESEANFIAIKGPELLSKWVGESEKAVREIFKKARQVSPAIIFIDEIDSIAPSRSASDGGNRVSEKVVNQLLTEMDGLQELNDVVVIAATNRPDVMDTALLRPGRFDRIVLAGVPDAKGRAAIFKIHTAKMPLAKTVDVKDLIEKTEGYVGADIEAVCREAAMFQLRKDMKAKEVSKASFDKAIAKVRPSASKEIQEAYAQLQDEFSSARGKEFKDEKPSYYG